MSRALLLLTLLASGALVSCDTGSDGNIEGGMFEITLTGESETTLDGRAYFTRAAPDPTTGREAVTLFLVDIGGDPILTAQFDEPPQNRAYRLNDDGAPTVLYRDLQTGTQRVATSGGVTVSTFSSIRLAGAIEVTVEDAQVFALFDADVQPSATSR